MKSAVHKALLFHLGLGCLVAENSVFKPLLRNCLAATWLKKWVAVERVHGSLHFLSKGEKLLQITHAHPSPAPLVLQVAFAEQLQHVRA